MKGSPIIATAITIVVLLGLYMGMRTLILPDSLDAQEKHAGHDHDHDHPHPHPHPHPSEDNHGDHDDSALNTDFELFFSSIPKSVTISQPSTEKEILKLTDISELEWSGPGVLNLNGHHVELQVDIEWVTPQDMNFVQVIVNPAQHASREVTLRSDDHISDIAELSW
ncbi:hypothetical protein [Rubritalea tangerina]|uniref:Uncharacterized protein n=1 Tax=Rubritalea tangerina TaxID=430798 RepID=A0ABW4Z831_9BACT